MDDRRGGRRECKVSASGNVRTRAAQVQQWHQVLHQTHSDWITGVTVRAKGREFPHLSTRIIAEFIDNQTRKKKSPPSGGQPRRLKTSTVSTLCRPAHDSPMSYLVLLWLLSSVLLVLSTLSARLPSQLSHSSALSLLYRHTHSRLYSFVAAQDMSFLQPSQSHQQRWYRVRPFVLSVAHSSIYSFVST